MKSLLIFLVIVAATLAWPNAADERHPSPNPLPFDAPWYLNENSDTNMAVKEQRRGSRSPSQNVFKAGQIYLFLGNNNLFLCSLHRVGGDVYLQSIASQQESLCRFAVSILESGKVAFSFPGDRHYLQLNPGGGVNSIRPTSPVIDDSAQFEVEVAGPGPWDGAHYVYLKAENGKYWGIVQEPVQNNIAADYEDREEATRLIVLEGL